QLERAAPAVPPPPRAYALARHPPQQAEPVGAAAHANQTPASPQRLRQNLQAREPGACVAPGTGAQNLRIVGEALLQVRGRWHEARRRCRSYELSRTTVRAPLDDRSGLVVALQGLQLFQYGLRPVRWLRQRVAGRTTHGGLDRAPEAVRDWTLP